jgi:hypothetical protein
MTGKRSPKLIIPATMAFALSLALYAAPQTRFRVASDLWGSLYNLPRTPAAPSKYPPGNGGGSADRVRHWNEIAINASGLDHTPVASGEKPRVWRTSGTGPGQPRHGDRTHRGF